MSQNTYNVSWKAANDCLNNGIIYLKNLSDIELQDLCSLVSFAKELEQPVASKKLLQGFYNSLISQRDFRLRKMRQNLDRLELQLKIIQHHLEFSTKKFILVSALGVFISFIMNFFFGTIFDTDGQLITDWSLWLKIIFFGMMIGVIGYGAYIIYLLCLYKLGRENGDNQLMDEYSIRTS